MADGTALTEHIVATLLRDRFATKGRGVDQWVFMTQVRNAAGFGATRTFDAVAMNLWPSKGLTIETFEIKVSRSDWQRELKDPAKSDDACKVSDRFWIVAPTGCVHDGELPPTWGLIEVTGDGEEKPWRLRQKKAAPLLHNQDTKVMPLSRSQVVGMLRSIPGAIPGGRLPAPGEDEIQTRIAAAVEKERERLGRIHERDIERAREGGRAVYEASERARKALMAAGLTRYQAGPEQVERHAPAIARVIRGEDAIDRLRQAHSGAERHLASLAEVLGETDG